MNEKTHINHGINTPGEDPNKKIFSVDPHGLTSWNQDITEGLLSSKCFDNGHGRSSNKIQRQQYYDYVLSRVTTDGNWMEFGVWKGDSINYISSKTRNPVFGFDSFEGLPSDWHPEDDFCPKGTFTLNGFLPKVNTNVLLLKGWFKDTLPKFLKNNTKHCSLIHLDCDLYAGADLVLRSLESRIVPGTVIMMDEYWYCHRWKDHEYKAFQEFIERTGLGYEYIAHTDRGKAAVKIL